MCLLDKEIFSEILKITCCILKHNFFYDDYCLRRFINKFMRVMEVEYSLFIHAADLELKTFLKYNDKARGSFTGDFLSYHLHFILVDYMHFSDQELNQFDNILSKIVGVANESNVQKSNERTHN